METHLSLKASKLLHDKGIEVESEKWWTLPEGKYVEVFMEMNPAYEDDELAPTKSQLTDNPDFYGVYGEPVNKIHAPSLQELFTALPAIGEKLGWDVGKVKKDLYEDSRGYYFDMSQNGERYIHVGHGKYLPKVREWENIAHKILDTYLAGGMEQVSSYIVKLLQDN